MNTTDKTKNSVISHLPGIFSNPVANATEEQKTAIEKYHQTYITLSQQTNEHQLQCKKTSRKIGEAKRQGIAVDELIKLMQAQSKKFKNLKTQMDDIVEKATMLFESNSYDNNSDKSTFEKDTARIYADTPTDDKQISVHLLNDENTDWNHYVESNSNTSLYHRSEWKALIQNTFGHKSYFFYAHNSSKEIIGILPLVRLKSKLFGDFMVSMPYFNYGGAIANSLLVEQKLIETANKHAEDLGINHIEYRDDITRNDLQTRTQKVNMILPLPRTHEDLWQAFSSKLRSQIKRPQRETTQISIGSIECLNDFYEVFCRNMRDLGTPVYSRNFFENILKTFPQNSKIIIIHLKHKPVAAAFLLGNRDMLEIPWASTIRDVNNLSINMLLYWEVLKFSIDKQYRYFDFGRSSKDSGTYRFKQQWGAKAKQLHWHYWLPDNAMLPELNPSNPKYALVINVWKRLPIWLTKIVGPYIVKNLP